MADYREVRAVQDELAKRYGGMMNLSEVRAELGKVSGDTAKRWLERHDIPGVMVGVKPRWESRLVAKAIVQSRGFC